MTRTFLVTMDMDAYGGTAEGLAEDIHEILDQDSLPVLTVTPWASTAATPNAPSILSPDPL